jgi:hypothetical protein
MTQLKSRQNSAEQAIMGTQNTEWKFIATTAFLVATIAVPLFVSLLSPEGPERATLVLHPVEQKVRQPASLPHFGVPKKPVVINDTGKELNNLIVKNSINFDFKCAAAKVTEFKIQGAYVQLKGHDCGKGSETPKLSITNKTNGFTASVFFLNGKEYQTDLIQLKEGENQIQIHYQNPAGQQEEHVLKVKSGTI